MQSQNASRKVLNLLEANARESQICVQILVANIGKPDPCLILEHFSDAYRSACQANESATEEICRTYFAHLQNKDIESLAKALRAIPPASRTFSRKSFLLASHFDQSELSMQTSLLQRISDTTTEMIVSFCRRNNLDAMIANRKNLKLLEEEADKLTHDRITRVLKNNMDQEKTILMLSLYSSIRELIDVCLNAGNSAFEIHLRYA